jgi:hypothetical protein
VPGTPERIRTAVTALRRRPGPLAELPWSASASPAFASGTVTGNTLGGLAFTFLILKGTTTGPISVRLGTDSTSGGDTDDTAGGPVPSSVPAGEGRGPTPLLLAGLLALAGVAGTAAIRHLRAGAT